MLGKFINGIRRIASRSEVLERAEIVEDVLYGRTSDADTSAVQAVAQLTTALCNNQCEGVVDAGTFVFFKVRANTEHFQIFHKKLTIRERRLLNNNPTILNEPYKILEKLEKAVALDRQQAERLREIAQRSNEKPPREIS